MLVDSHCHLDYLQRDGDLDAVVARARRSGVGTMLTICTKLSEFSAVRSIAESYDEVWCTVGVHPHEAAGEAPDASGRLVDLARHPKVVGIGETGLDHYYANSPRADQKRSLRHHLAAPRERGMHLGGQTEDA